MAFFVLKLFLPVVVFLFGLFFLLSLKFCIPPSISISAGLKAELDALPGGIDVDAGLSASVALQLNEDLKLGIAIDSGVPLVDPVVDDPDAPSVEIPNLHDFSNAALLPLGTRINEASSLTVEESASAGLDLTGNLEFEPRVEVTIG